MLNLLSQAKEIYIPPRLDIKLLVKEKIIQTGLIYIPPRLDIKNNFNIKTNVQSPFTFLQG